MAKIGNGVLPSQPATIVFTVLYGIACIICVGQYIYYKSWFWIFMVLGSIMEIVGYIAKTLFYNNQDSRTLYIIQYVLILLAPAVMAAAVYMCMARIALHVTPAKHQNVKTLWVSPRFMTLIFVLSDVLGFLVQTIGGVMATSTDIATIQRGFDVLKGGLILQIVAFGFFLLISFRFHLISKSYREEWPETRWKTMLWALNAGSTIIFVRSIYRLIEFSQGFQGYLFTHDWNFFLFESAFMLIVLAIFSVYHPAQYLVNIGWKQTNVNRTNAAGSPDGYDLENRDVSAPTAGAQHNTA